MPGSEYCIAHTVHDFIADEARKRSKRAKTLGDAIVAGVFGLGAAAMENMQKHDIAQKAYLLYQMRQAQRAQRPPPEKKPDPFAVLRLDAKTATVEDVRRVQRKLAEAYHADTGASGVASDAMAEVNAAAEAAIKAINARDGKV
jgi:hypothetical protein